MTGSANKQYNNSQRIEKNPSNSLTRNWDTRGMVDNPSSLTGDWSMGDEFSPEESEKTRIPFWKQMWEVVGDIVEYVE